MLRDALPQAERARLIVLPMRDYYDEPRWAQAVRQAVAENTPAAARIALVGHFKDDTSGYLRAFPGWELIRMARQGAIDATPIRDAYFGATPDSLDAALAPLAQHLPTATRSWLQQFAYTPHYPALQEEWRMLRAYRASWAGAPYPPVFVTVDALLRCQGRVLLIRRGHAPGKGLWALPGGFIDPQETLLEGCLRELREETRLKVPEPVLRGSLKAQRTFDDPFRSARGRTITQAFFFQLRNDPDLPKVKGHDDARQAFWVPLADLNASRLFEDHYAIICELAGL